MDWAFLPPSQYPVLPLNLGQLRSPRVSATVVPKHPSNPDTAALPPWNKRMNVNINALKFLNDLRQRQGQAAATLADYHAFYPVKASEHDFYPEYPVSPRAGVDWDNLLYQEQEESPPPSSRHAVDWDNLLYDEQPSSRMAIESPPASSHVFQQLSGSGRRRQRRRPSRRRATKSRSRKRTTSVRKRRRTRR